VLQIHTRYRERGGEDVVADLERELLRDGGHEVHALRLENAGDPLHAAAQIGKYIAGTSIDGQVLTAAEEFEPDVVHVHNTWFACPLSSLSRLRRSGIPTVMTVHNYRSSCVNAQLFRRGQPCELCVGSSPWSGVRHRCYRGSLAESAAAALAIRRNRGNGNWAACTDRFLALTDFSRSRLVAGGLPADKMLLHSNWVPDPGPRSAPPESSQTVACIGRLSAEKGFDVVLDAWRKLGQSDLRLVVAGDGPERDKLADMVSPGVEMVGSLSRGEVRELLLKSRAVLIPSLWYESQPMVALESLAAGTPVLGSCIGGLGETLAPLGAAWTAIPGAIDDWASRIKAVGSDELIAQAGPDARRLYETKYLPGAALRRLEAVYDEVIARGA
jgi:glycosyltransferase involved in cell wall biosynthesis